MPPVRNEKTGCLRTINTANSKKFALTGKASDHMDFLSKDTCWCRNHSLNLSQLKEAANQDEWKKDEYNAVDSILGILERNCTTSDAYQRDTSFRSRLEDAKLGARAAAFLCDVRRGVSRGI